MNITSKTPKVSVVMPVYNGEKYLRDAVESILGQTFGEFEFIIVDDASQDSSVDIIRQYNDPRIHLVRHESNLGVAHSRNRGITLAQGMYIAHMDADDVSRRDRLAKQVAFLDANPDYGVVGTWAEIWHKSEKTRRAHRHPTESLILKYELLFDSHFVNSSAMIRKKAFHTTGLYRTDVAQPYPEDYALWSKIATQFEMANLGEYLHVYREVPASQTRQTPALYRSHVIGICARNLASALGLADPDRGIIGLAAYIHGAYVGIPTPMQSLKWVATLFNAANKLSDANHAPRSRLRARAYARAGSLLRAYPAQILSTAPCVKASRRSD